MFFMCITVFILCIIVIV